MYDHAWPLYAPALGEPHLSDDILVYTDRSVAHVAAFPVGDVAAEMSPTKLQAVVDRHASAELVAVNVWGRIINTPEYLVFRGAPFDRVYACGYAPERVELSIPIVAGTLETDRHLRRMVARIRKQQFEVAVEKPLFLSEEHFALMREMLETHAVSPFDTALLTTIPALIRDADAVVVEARRGGILKGFGLVWLPDNDRALVAWSFSRREPGVRTGDVLMEATIRLCAERRKRFLHLGYCETRGIWDFKTKWGAIVTGPEYREALYVRRDCELPPAQQRWITWRERFQMWKEERTG